MKPKISVIVPVYNDETWLPRCLRSLEEQTMREGLEILLIDDGSTDASGALCDGFAAAHANARVVHRQRNGGLSDARVVHRQQSGSPSNARNTALDLAQGEYVLFLDSDDFFLPETCARAYGLAGETGAEIVSFAIIERMREEDMGELTPPPWKRELLTDAVTIFRRFLYTYSLSGAVTGILFRRELFADLRFPTGMVCEDTYLLPSLLIRARSVLLVPEYLYFYRQRPGSVMHTLGSRFADDRLTAHEEIARVVRANIPEMAAEMTQYLYCVRIRCLQEILMAPNPRRHSCFKGQIRAFRRLLPEMMRAPTREKFTPHRKRYAFLLALFPGIIHLRLRRRLRQQLQCYAPAAEN